MKLKYYIGSSVVEAISQAKEELGENAIIISTQQSANGKVRVTAALEETEIQSESIAPEANNHNDLNISHIIRKSLLYHGIAPRLMEKILTQLQDIKSDNPHKALTHVINKTINFTSLTQNPKNFIFVGPHGCGKTLTIAKLATYFRKNDLLINIITTDDIKAGSFEQLSSFTNALGVELTFVKGHRTLEMIATESKDANDLTIIDTPGVNPFDKHDMEMLDQYIQASQSLPILVMSGGGDPIESEEISKIFAKINVKHILPTKLDTTRRLGGILSAAFISNMQMCEISISKYISQSLYFLDSDNISTLLLSANDNNDNKNEFNQDKNQQSQSTQDHIIKTDKTISKNNTSNNMKSKTDIVNDKKNLSTQNKDSTQQNYSDNLNIQEQKIVFGGVV